ncbi:ABC transporter ATP-binding protein [Halobacillus locisalis]|uniref:ABC transporter ATP-binding protein n=1 Tax=Halobacillus locisalis TaxID=220753 RepID=A0A838CUP6_9BACI|nr:ABC transporter ATP-binding protein [Halobacillus locisalis]MBA2175872.1 ABC transporter ATP-binding protein [Halobacillus locisalis]
MIEAHQITKRFLTTKAIEGIDLRIDPGKIYGIIGENGSGKSTLLKLLSGLLHPSKGSITINGEPVTRQSASTIAYMTDFDRFYPYFKVSELVSFYESQFVDFNKNKAEDILDFLAIDHEQKLKHLSKGNLGRVKLAVTVAREAPFLLLDEPLSGLDPMVRESIVKGIIQFVDFDRQSLVITTHEIRDIEPLLDEVIIIHEGKKLDQQRVDDIRMKEQLDVEGWLKRRTR